jgi:hypothetical protein
MKPTDALRLDNLLCLNGYLQVRKGRQPLATGFVDPIETLMSYTDTAGANKLFAAAGDSFFDATASGAIGAAVATGFSNAYWQAVQFTNTAGSFLIACNGVDDAQIYDGASWAALGITGLAPDLVGQVSTWKRRLWCVEVDSMSAWYGATDAISGAVTEFSFSGIFQRGGYLVAVLNWTLDGGAGADDYLVAVTSQGEIAVYQGTDPSSASTFALVGLYYIGPPVGRRFYAQYGGDLLLLTSEGVLALSRYLQSQTVNKTAVLTDRIQQLISADISSYGGTQGWEIHVHHDANFLLIQVPAGPSGFRYQYVMSLFNGGWSRFIIGAANTWCVQKNILFMGDDTQTYNAWTGGLDDQDPIPYYVTPAFSYFETPTQVKKFNLSRVLFEADVRPKFRYQFLGDFNLNTVFAPLAPDPAGGNLWDVALWDAAFWDALIVYSRNWYSLPGLAYAATQGLFGISTGDVTRIISFDYAYEVGGLL